MVRGSLGLARLQVVRASWRQNEALWHTRLDHFTGSAFITALFSLHVPVTGRFEALANTAWKVCYRKSQAEGEEEAMPAEVLPKSFWPHFFSDPTEWWDNTSRINPTTRHLELRDKLFNVTMWLNNMHKPAWVELQIATGDAGMMGPPESTFTSIQWQGAIGRLAANEDHLEVGKCRKLCEEGRIADAVDVLNLLVQRGCNLDNKILYLALKSCIALKDLVLGRRIHALAIKTGHEGQAFLATHLIGLYASHARLEEAMQVFSKVSMPDTYNWATIISAYAKHGEAAQAIRLYRHMRESTSLQPDDHIFSAVLNACAAAGDLLSGREVHSHILASSGKHDMFVQTGLVDMYAKCGSLGDARTVFDRLSDRNVVTWTAMIAGYAQQGMGQEALRIYNSMQEEGLSPPDSVTYVCLLQACASVGVGALHQAKQIHAEIQKRGLQDDLVIGGSLVNMWAKCGSLEDALNVFDNMPVKDVVTWNVMIAGYSQQGMGQAALSLYNNMQLEGVSHPDSVTYICLLQACASVGTGALHQGKQLHAEIREQGLQDDMVLGGSLVNMYAKCGSLEDARRLFNTLPARNVFTWTSIIAGYAQQGMGTEALSLYTSMQMEGFSPPESVTYICLLQACSTVGVGALLHGKQLHAQILERGLQDDVVVGGSLVSMYAKCGSLEDTRRVFDMLPARNIVTWTAMIACYVQQGMGEEALRLYDGMQQEFPSPPDSVTYVCLLQACASVGVGALDQGKQLHAQIQDGLQDDVVIGGSLVNMYAKCGSLEDAREVFDRLPTKNIVTWTSMISGYAQQGMGLEALSLYRSMQQDGLSPPDSVTFICLLQACAIVAALPLGEQLHAQIKERGLQADPGVGAALVNMYAKCGSMYDSQQVFDFLPERTIEAWNALVGGYSRHGASEVVFQLVDRMRLEGTCPNDITFLSVLMVCSHVGLVDKGEQYFDSMRADYGMSPTVEHHICVIDLLGRAGHLNEALHMAKTLPFPPISTVWHTLLAACRKWNNIEISLQAFELAVNVDAKDAAAYVLMSNIYASGQMWEKRKEMQARRVKTGAWKKPGQSWWTDMGGVVHSFGVGDKKHPESEGIYARLEQLIPDMKKAGYIPHLDSSLRDTSDDEREAELCGHSEKLAIAYALNKTPQGTTIRIVKNLRVCEDCHSATAFISKIEKRTIICRDASRFHVYSQGKCSCGDYW